MLLNMKFAKANYGILPLLAFILICTSCGDSSQAEGTKTIQSEKEVAAYDLFPKLSEVTMGLGNIVRDGFNELEHEVNLASSNEGGVVDSARFTEFAQRHKLRVEALFQLSDNLASMKPRTSEELLHSACKEVANAMEAAHNHSFPLVMGLLQKGLDEAGSAKTNPFAEMSQTRVEIEANLAKAEGMVKANLK
jgi:hypothetical protein